MASRLRELDDAVAAWDTKVMREPEWKSKVTPESESSNNEGRSGFEDLDGRPRLFDLHARFTPGPGRIHMRLITEAGKVRIAYIGRKLGVLATST